MQSENLYAISEKKVCCGTVGAGKLNFGMELREKSKGRKSQTKTTRKSKQRGKRNKNEKTKAKKTQKHSREKQTKAHNENTKQKHSGSLRALRYSVKKKQLSEWSSDVIQLESTVLWLLFQPTDPT